MAPRAILEAAPMSESNGIPDTNVLFGDVSSIDISNIVSSPLPAINAHDALKRALNATSRTNATLLGDENPNFDPSKGAAPATSFNNKGFLALFALLGAAMVLASIWFFFWAKNGGFRFQEGDWEDYKSTVLRRKGPDGRTLTNATKSTKLGGSTIAGTQHYKWAKHAARSVVSYDSKGRKGILGRRGWGKTHSVTYRDDFTDYGYGDSKTYSDETTDLRNAPESPPQHERTPVGYRDRDVQEYKREKPARVGGLNRVPDGSHIGGATTTDGSDLYSDSDHHYTPTKNRDTTHHHHDDKERAERRARAEAAKMERRWKREAEEAAAALARQSTQQQPAVPPHAPRKTASPSKPSGTRQRSASRSASPKKREQQQQRDFSYQTGPGSEQLSTTTPSYTATTSDRTPSSYYDAYRPRGASGNQSQNARYSMNNSDRRQSSPAKKADTGARGRRDGAGGGGYRRGADSDLD